MKKINLATAPNHSGSDYPSPFDVPCRERQRWKLGDAAGLTRFGVNLLRLPPGSWSSQRHWHSAEDEFVYVLEGELVLVTDDGEETLRPGDCAGFRAGEANGHHLVNRGDREATVFEVGGRAPDRDAVTYPDIDLALDAGTPQYRHRDGTPYA